MITINELKKVKDEVPKTCRGTESMRYSEDIVFVTEDGEAHNGFYADYAWFDRDENSVYFTDEVTEWIYFEDIKEN